MDRVFKSHTGEEDAHILEQARRDVGINHQLELDAIYATGNEKVAHGFEEKQVETSYGNEGQVATAESEAQVSK